MGAVYVAEHTRLQRKVALKVLSSELGADRRFRDRFIRESRLAASLEHPNIVPIYDAGDADGVLYIAMRLVEGTDLRGLIQMEGPLDPLRAVELLSQVAGALDAAHGQGLVHRDVKPGNVLMARGEGDGERAYLADFGLTKRTSSDSGLTATGQFVGTLDYAAPEQFEGGILDGRTDVYSLGCVLYECLTGKVPYPRDRDAAVMFAHLMAPVPSASEIHPGLPPSLDQVVARAMAKRPDDRFPTCGELAAAAAAALGPAEVQGPRRSGRRGLGSTEVAVPSQPKPVPSPAETGLRGAPWRWRWLWAAAVLAVVVVVPVAAILSRGGGATPSPGSTRAPGGTEPASSLGLVRIDPLQGGASFTRSIGKAPASLAPGAGAVWVSDTAENLLYRIDPATGEVTHRIDVGPEPTAVAVGWDSVWVANRGDGTVSRVDPRTNDVAKSISVGSGIDRLSVGEGGVWVGNTRAETVSKIDPARDEVVKSSIPTPGLADLVASHGFVWVIQLQRDINQVKLATIDPDSYRFDDSYYGLVQKSGGGSVTPSPRVVIGDDGLWITGGAAGIVTRLTFDALDAWRAEGDRLAAHVDYVTIGGVPDSLAADRGGFVWVANTADGTVWKLSTDNGRPDGGPIAVGGKPSAIAAGQGGVWVLAETDVAGPSG
jgi:YVTN family beta-propeller protein